jgi:hypothetical protein
MTCPHTTSTTREYNACGLGLYGGRPSHGTCAQCMARGENTPEHAAKIKATPPTIPQQAARLGKSLVNWTASGFSPTPPDILSARQDICKACPEWDEIALNNTGRCKKCGCSTWAKLRMATEKCPIDKWGPVTPSSPEQQPNTN